MTIKMLKIKEDLKKAEYKGHRERIRKRFLDKGIHSFSDYEILVIFTFYCNAQEDTKTNS